MHRSVEISRERRIQWSWRARGNDFCVSDREKVYRACTSAITFAGEYSRIASSTRVSHERAVSFDSSSSFFFPFSRQLRFSGTPSRTRHEAPDTSGKQRHPPPLFDKIGGTKNPGLGRGMKTGRNKSRTLFLSHRLLSFSLLVSPLRPRFGREAFSPPRQREIITDARYSRHGEEC